MRYLKALVVAASASVLAAACASSGSKGQASSKPPAVSRPVQAPPPPAASPSTISSYADLNALFGKGAAPSADGLGGVFELKMYGRDGVREKSLYVVGANFQPPVLSCPPASAGHAECHAMGPMQEPEFKVVPLGFISSGQAPDSDTVFSAAESKAPSVSGAVPTSQGLEFDVTQCAPGAELPLCRDEWRSAGGMTILHISCWHDAAGTVSAAVDLMGHVTSKVYAVSSKPLPEAAAPACAAQTPPPASASVAGTWRGLYTQKVGGDSCGPARTTVCDPWGMQLDQSGSAVSVIEGCCGSSCGKAGWTGSLKGKNVLINASNASCGGANPVMKVRCSLQGTETMSCKTSGSTCGRCGNDAVTVSGNAILTRSTETLASITEPAPSCVTASSAQVAGSWPGSFTISMGQGASTAYSLSFTLVQNGAAVQMTGGTCSTGSQSYNCPLTGTWSGCLNGDSMSLSQTYTGGATATMNCHAASGGAACAVSGDVPVPGGVSPYAGNGTISIGGSRQGCVSSIPSPDGTWTLQIVAATTSFTNGYGCSSPGQTLTVAVSNGQFSAPTNAVTCGTASSSMVNGTITSSGTLSVYFDNGGTCQHMGCCSSATSCSTGYDPNECPQIVMTKQP